MNTNTNTKELLKARIENDFKYHAPKEGQIEKYQEIREAGKNMALVLLEHCPLGRELSLALTSIETAVMQANASIARS